MRYDYIWDSKAKLWVVVDTWEGNRSISVHWTTGEAEKQAALYEVGPEIYQAQAA